MFKKIFSIFLALFSSLILMGVHAQDATVHVNMDVRHILGKDSVLDRKKMVNIHADTQEREWEGDNAVSDLRNNFLNGYDVYLGRNTGGITWNLNNNMREDATRPGFANAADIVNFGNSTKATYANRLDLHPYEHRNDQVLCAQLHPFYPDGKKTNKGWALSTADTPTEPFGTATGEFIGGYIKNFYGNGGTTGMKKPMYYEIINEPLWHLVDYGTDTPERVFRFHNNVAAEIRKQNPGLDIEISGYCAAFPDLDKNGFKEWEERFKLFMDMSGDQMDAWSIHLYDFPTFGGKQLYRKGSNMEATFDMMEQYSFMKFGKVKPFMISEFGAQTHDYKGAWSPYRDWLHMKSVNSMMMQFMERSNIISKAINFLPVKAEWGTASVDKTYDHRLMRKENEPASYTGKWVYTDNVKTYQLWANVKGLRVDARSNNPDVLTNAFVHENKLYVLINNLEFKAMDIDLQVLGNSQLAASLKVKHMYLNGNVPVLDESNIAVTTKSLTVKPEGMMVLEYAFPETLSAPHRSLETKYYADAYYKPIRANAAEVFKFNNVAISQYNEAVLRLGVGRAHGKSLQPKIMFNGVEVKVPVNYRGDNQKDRANFFGVLEIPVPQNLLQPSNTVSVTFSDEGGHISSVTMQVYQLSKDLNKLPAPPQLAEFSQVLFAQNFESAKNVNVSNYFSGVHAESGIDGTFNFNSFETLSTPTATMKIWSNSGAHSLLINKPVTTSAADGKNRFAFMRTFDLEAASMPQVAQFKFDYEVSNNAGTFANQDAITINIGEGLALDAYGNGQNEKSLARLHILVGQLDGRTTLRDPNKNTQGVITSGVRKVTIVLNNSVDSLAYYDPSGNSSKVGPGKYDVYLENTLTFNEVAIITPGLKIKEFRIGAHSPTINGGGAPSKYDIKFDNFSVTALAPIIPEAVDDENIVTNEDEAVTVDVLKNDIYKGTVSLGIKLGAVVNGTAEVVNGKVIFTPNKDYNGVGSFSYKATAGELESNEVDVKITINPVNDAPVVTIDKLTQSVQYSDPVQSVTISATDVDNDALHATVTGMPLGLTLHPEANDLTNTGKWIISGKADDKPGTYKVVVNIFDGEIIESTNFEIIIKQEDASAVYTGMEFASTADVNNSTAQVLLRAAIQDVNDNNRGDITKSMARFVVRPFTNDNPFSVTPVFISEWMSPLLIASSDKTTGQIEAVANINIGAEDYASYNVFVEVGADNMVESGNYISVNEVNAIINVARPLSDFVTGGGNIVISSGNNSAAGKFAADIASKVNFGVNIKTSKSGSNLKGNVNIVFRRTEGGVIKTYRIKSTSLNAKGNSLGIGSKAGDLPTTRRANLKASAVLQDITSDNSYFSMGGLSLELALVDKGEPGKEDELAITLWNGNELLFSNSWTGINTLSEKLNGGNIKISKLTSNNRQSVQSASQAHYSRLQLPGYEKVGAGLGIIVSPNPTNYQFNIKIDSDLKSTSMKIEVFDIAGRLVEVIQNLKAGQTIQIGANYHVGNYFLVLMQQDRKKVVKVVKGTANQY